MKLKIGAKLGLGFGTVLVLTIVSSLLSYRKSAEIKDLEHFILGSRVPSLQTLLELKDDLDYTGSKARQAILAATDPARKADAQKRFESSWERLDKTVAKLDELTQHWRIQLNKDHFAELKDNLPKVRVVQEASIATASTGGRDGVIKGGDEYADKATLVVDASTKTLGELIDGISKSFAEQQELLDSTNSSLTWTMLIATLTGLIVGAFVAIFLSRKISTATASALQQAEAIADGDLSGEEALVTSQDELGDLTTAMNRMHASLRKVVQGISDNAQNVANASEEFSSVSQQISANSEETSAQAGAVSAATEEVNRNLQTVATATEEMSASISEIAKNAGEAARVAAQAMRAATETTAVVNKLGDSSAQIGQVIKAITSIAQKTDLLALNATVEAARAGEVGAGFAVVANEVKELAKQTAAATEDIAKKIDTIQTDAKSAVAAIKEITGIIDQVNQISATIATAVEEQSATTSEMSRNLSEAAKGSGEVAQNITGVAQAAQNTSHGATDSQKAAQQLALMSTQLRGLVQQFKLESNGHGGNSGRGGRAREPRLASAEV
jgi:methyl-accepting chemotaxis protein